MTATQPAPRGTSLRHGQRSTYTHYGCRCRWCRHAESAYQAARDRSIGYGTWKARVSTAPVRQHLQALVEAGVSGRQAATRAGIPYAAVRRVTFGASGRPPSVTMGTDLASRILAVPIPAAVDPAGARLVDATGSRRRLQALTVSGWPLLVAAGRDRITARTWRDVRSGRLVQVAPATEVAIREAYDRLWDQSPVGACRWGDVRAATALGFKHRWAPPLAWDDDEINDPAVQPSWTGRCGTTGGYYDHSQLGTPTCSPCRTAVSQAARDRKLRRRARSQSGNALEMETA